MKGCKAASVLLRNPTRAKNLPPMLAINPSHAHDAPEKREELHAESQPRNNFYHRNSSGDHRMNLRAMKYESPESFVMTLVALVTTQRVT